MADRKNDKFVTKLFNDRDTAEREWTSLRSRGYGDRDINVLMSEEGRRRHFADGHKTELGDRAAKGGATGAGLLIAGPLAAALAGAGAGAVTGGVLGALVNMGIPKERAHQYESGLKKGGILFGLEPHTEDRDYFDREWTPESVDVRGTGQGAGQGTGQTF